ncbi:MAG: DUF2797 domain-containing protein [Fibrobacterales bacterium]
MITGTLKKMHTTFATPIEYGLPIGGTIIKLNPYIGKAITLTFNGIISCAACGTRTKKSFAQGHCFSCMQKLASCDICILKPELCHHHKGTCRQPEWGLMNCMNRHAVYIANSSGLKVGITHRYKEKTRWMDQGAVQAVEIAEVPTRLDSGKLEIAIAEHIADKTNWRKMLKNEVSELDLKAEREEIFKIIPDEFKQFLLKDAEPVEIVYPVEEYPSKIVSHNFDKEPVVHGILKGIKGQYLIFDTGVINIRKFTGYTVTFSEA